MIFAHLPARFIPTDEQIAEYRAKLPTNRRSQHAYCVGVLTAVIEVLAPAHATCRVRSCEACHALTRALACLMALERAGAVG